MKRQTKEKKAIADVKEGKRQGQIGKIERQDNKGTVVNDSGTGE